MTEDELIARYIEPNPHRPGLEEARLVDCAVPIWALIGYWNGAEGDTAATAYAYDVPLEAIEAALAYYHRHEALIENRLMANAAEIR